MASGSIRRRCVRGLRRSSRSWTRPPRSGETLAMLIAQLSDVHVGGGRYREELLRAAIEEINAAAPDLVVAAGDLTDEGYPDQYPLAKEELSVCWRARRSSACRATMPPAMSATCTSRIPSAPATRASASSSTGLKSHSSRSTPPSPTSTKARSDVSTTAGSRRASGVRPTYASSSVTTTWFRCREPAASETRCLTRATSSRYFAGARSTSSSPATATSRMSGPSRACCSSTPAPSPRCARAASQPRLQPRPRRGGADLRRPLRPPRRAAEPG
jgi:hypothetical protein